MSLPDIYSVLASAVGRTVVLREGSHIPVKIASVHRTRAGVTLTGRTLDGTKVSHAIPHTASSPLVFPWMTRLASIMRVAWNGHQWNDSVNALIQQVGLPVDPSADWDQIINGIFNQKGIATKDPEWRDDLIHEMLFRLIKNGAFAKFRPDAVENPSPDYANLPLERKVAIFVAQLMRYQLGPHELGRKINQMQPKEEVQVTNPDVNEDFADTIPGDTDSPHDTYLRAESIKTLREFRAAFGHYLRKHREGALPNKVMFLFDLIAESPTQADTRASWEATVGTSVQDMRKTLYALSEEMDHFARSGQAPKGSTLTQIINDIRLKSMGAISGDLESREWEPSLDAMNLPGAEPEEVEEEEEPEPVGVGPMAQAMHTSSVEGDAFPIDAVKTAAFMRSLQNEVVRLASEGSVFTMKIAKPKVVDSSVLFVVLETNPVNYLNMNIRFGGPSIAKTPGAGTEYTIDVGMYGPDRSLPENKIKKQLNALVFPSMRADVPESYHNLLEKVIRELRSIIWENAVDYFDTPQEERRTWHHVIRMDVLTLQDVKVNIADQDGAVMSVTGAFYTKEDEANKDLGQKIVDTHESDRQKAVSEGLDLLKNDATPKESNMTTTKHAGLKRLAAEAPEEISTKVETLKQKLLSQVENLENMQAHLDMSPEAEEKFAGLKRTAAEEPEEIDAAFEEIYLGLDDIMADMESLSDSLGVELPSTVVKDGDVTITDTSSPDDDVTEEEEVPDEVVVEIAGQ